MEERLGLKAWSLRGVLDPSNPQIPSVDRAAEICAAIGLEFYVGLSPRPKFKGVAGELGVELATWQHMLWCLERAVLTAEALEQEADLSQARITAAGFIRSVVEGLVRAQDGIEG